MTRAVCALILHTATLRLTWRSIKSLKLPPDMMDSEILKLWSLLSFHTLYSRSLEYFLSYLPLYYYVKMIILAATFLPGTRIPNVWFETFLVPGIGWLHCVMDVDIKGWCWYQFRLAPLRLVDLFLLPGILSTDFEMKERRRLQLQEARLRMPLVPKPISSSWDDKGVTDRHQANLVVSDTESEVTSIVPIVDFGDTAELPPSPHQDRPEKTLIAQTADYERREQLEEWRAKKNRSRVENQKERLIPRMDQSPSQSILSTRSKMKNAVENPERGGASSASTTNPGIKELRVPRQTVRQSSSMGSPVVRSRMVASSMHLRRFSQDHKVPSSPPVDTKKTETTSHPPPDITVPQPKHSTTTCDAAVSNESPQQKKNAPPSLSRIFPKTAPTNNKCPLTSSCEFVPPENEQPQANTSMCIDSEGTDNDSRGEKRRRRSLGEQVRALVTGDANIRVRDYLFDLDLPSLPSPHSAGHALGKLATPGAQKEKKQRVDKDRPNSSDKEKDTRRSVGTVLHRHKLSEKSEATVSSSSKSHESTRRKQETSGIGARRSRSKNLDSTRIKAPKKKSAAPKERIGLGRAICDSSDDHASVRRSQRLAYKKTKKASR